jgi:hypothetical protein
MGSKKGLTTALAPTLIAQPESTTAMANNKNNLNFFIYGFLSYKEEVF